MTDFTDDDSASNCDLQLCVDSAFGQKFLNAVEFPLQVDFPSDSFADSDVEPYLDDGEVIEDEPPSPVERAQNGEDSDELGEVMQEVVAQALLDSYQQAQDETGPADTEDAPTEDKLPAVYDKKRTKVEIISLSLIVPTAPTLHVGNPISLSDITVKIHAKIKVCVRVLGRWRCVRASIPWVTLSGREAILQLSSEGPIIYATPIVKNIDMTVAVKIFKWSVKCKLGLTRIVNRELRKRGPIQLVDLSSFEQSIPYSEKRPSIDSITFANGPKGLVVKSTFCVR